jgi:glutathione peroxidase
MKLLVSLLTLAFFVESTVYNLSMPAASGATINMSDFRNKKVLLVNTASNSKYNVQLDKLQELQVKYHDSLVVIMVPSNSFNNEPLSGADIAAQAQAKGYGFLVAAKTDVAGASSQAVYQWLADKQQNTRISVPVKDDFMKILLDKKGMISGIFASQLSPMDSLMQKAITSPTR